MTTYTPDCWVMIEVRPKDGEPIRKILAGWSGGYLYGDSWKINSGITETREYDDRYEFDGYSGSTYVCYKTAERMNMIMMSTLSSLQTDMFDAGIGTIEVIQVGEDE